VSRTLQRPALFAGALAAAWVLASTPALADARAELEKARASFLSHSWADAEARLRALLDPETGAHERALVSQARMYLGAILVGEGKIAEAKELFGKLVLEDPSFDPDPLSFPSEAINTFFDARSGALEELRKASQAAARNEEEKRKREKAQREAQAAWLEKLKQQASEEEVTVRHSRVIASLPFGAGQFQNGQTALGFVFLGAEVAAVAGTVITYAMYTYARQRESDELNGTDRTAPQYHARAEDIRLVNLGFVGGFLVAAGIGIAQANIAFVPERLEKRKRDLPPLPATPAARLTPVVVPLGDRGVVVGIRGVVF
jgi:hypothetical protein